jgi:hypothetical protein
MKFFLKNISFIFLIIILNSCVTSIVYKYDYGKQSEYRYMQINESQFYMDVVISSDRDDASISILTKFNAPNFIKDTVSIVNFVDYKLTFNDGTVLKKVWSPLNISAKCYDKVGNEVPCGDYVYTCSNFKKVMRKNKYLKLELVYEIDSLGKTHLYKKKYQLTKKMYYRLAVH